MLKQVWSAVCVLGVSLSGVALAQTEQPMDCPEEGEQAMSIGMDMSVGYVRGWYGDDHPVSAYVEGRSAVLVPYAIGHCQSFTPASGYVGMFTCGSDGNSFTLTMYDSFTECSNTVNTTVTTFTQADLDTINGGMPLLGFDCSADRMDKYAQVTLAPTSAAACSASKVSTYFALETCVMSALPPDFTQVGFYNWYCMDTEARLQIYTGADNSCDADSLCDYRKLVSSCTKYATIGHGTIDVYARLVSCSEKSTTTTSAVARPGALAAYALSTALALLAALLF